MREPLAETLNREDHSESLAPDLLTAETARWFADSENASSNVELSTLFASVPVFVTSEHVAQMAETIEAIEALTQTPLYQQRVTERAPEIARFPTNAKGVFFGYDFHLDATGPKLIEVNTNAGGALLNLLLSRAQRLQPNRLGCQVAPASDLEGLEERFV
jgi:hypothetical protein